MNSNKKPSKFGLGLIVGGVVGAITALFFSPGSGKENREAVVKKAANLRKLLEEKEIDKKVMEIFGEVSAEAKTIYLKAKEELIAGLSQLKETISEIDKEKYVHEVEKVIAKLRQEFKKEAHQFEKLKEGLVSEWDKLRSTI